MYHSHLHLTRIAQTQQTDVHETSLCVLLVLEILCSNTKLTFVLTL